MTVTAPSFFERIGLALRVLGDASFASRLLGEEPRALAAPASAPVEPPEPRPASAELAADGALQLLALLQRDGRFVDFVQQDIDAFGDAEVGAAARVVHEGCRRALQKHASIASVRTEAEGARVELATASPAVKLVGNVAGSAPFRGVLRHRGWRIEGLKLPVRVGDYDATIVAQAEIEL